jgi:hypothetical protein
MQLEIVIDKITSYVLLFALIANIRRHTDAEDMGPPSMVWVTLFILDFVSTWFRSYSIFLAGERREVVSSGVSRKFLSLYRDSFVG